MRRAGLCLPLPAPDQVENISSLSTDGNDRSESQVISPAKGYAALWSIASVGERWHITRMLHINASAIICSVRPHGEVGAIVRALSAEHGMLAGYVQGARGRHLRPVLIAGNIVKGDWNARLSGQLATLKAELAHSRAHILGEPLAAAAIDWVTALSAATLVEAHPYPRLHSALDGVLSAIELAPAARGWANAVASYEELLLRELGFGISADSAGNETGEMMARNRQRLVEHMLGERRGDLMAARERLVGRLKKAAV